MALRPRFPLGTPALLLSETRLAWGFKEVSFALLFVALRLPFIVTVTGLPVASRISTSTLMIPLRPEASAAGEHKLLHTLIRILSSSLLTAGD
jgi:hypothetical protein